MKDINDQYPIGPAPQIEAWHFDELSSAIDEIEMLPKRIEDSTSSWTQEHWNRAYRSGGWNGQQVVHHLADSHMNAYIRMKLALTEEKPSIKPYNESTWAELPDYQVPILVSQQLLKALHERWVKLMRSLDEEQLKRTYYHPQNEKYTMIGSAIFEYAWHGNHHLGHLNIIDKK